MKQMTMKPKSRRHVRRDALARAKRQMPERIFQDGNDAVKVWWFLNDAKVQAVAAGWTLEKLLNLKQECDSLFFQATGCPIHPAWWIGGW
jgi:hypothetical protein